MLILQKQIKLPGAVLFAIFLGSFLVLYYLPYLYESWTFYRADLSLQFEPTCRFVGNALAHGHLPLWNPYLGCGLSEVAELSANIFCPFTLLFACSPFGKALAINLIIHQLICGIGAYLFIEAIGWGAWAAAVAGIICSLNGYMFSVANLFVLGTTAAWIPPSMYFLLRMKQTLPEIRASHLVMLSLMVALQIYDGRPEIYGPFLLGVMVWLGLQLIVAMRAPSAQRAKFAAIVKSVGCPALAIFCGILLAAPSLLPPMEWAKLSVRGHGLSAGEVLLWSADWYDWLGMILPQPLGDSQQLYNPLPFLASDCIDVPAFIESSFVGAPVVLFALIGALSVWWRQRWVSLALLVLLISIAAGHYLPVLPWLLTWVPGISLFRYPSKELILVIFVLAVFAAAGVKTVQDRALSRRQMYAGAGLLLLLFVPEILTALRVSWLPLFNLAERKNSVLLQGFNFSYLIHIAQVDISRSAMFAAALVAACLILCAFYQFGKLRRTLMFSLLSGLVLLPIAWQDFANARHAADGGFYSKPSFAYDQLMRLGYNSSSETPRIAQLYSDSPTLPIGYHAPHRRLSRSDTLQYSRQLLDLNLNEDFAVPSIFVYEGRIKGNYWHLCDISRNESSVFSSVNPSDLPFHRLCQLTGVSYVLTQAYSRSDQAVIPLPLLDSAYFALANEWKPLNLRIFKVKDPLPRAYFRDQWTVVQHNESVLQRVIDRSSTFDPAHTTFVEDLDESQSGQPPRTSREVAGIVPIAIMEETPEHLRLIAEYPRPGIVVLADQFYPGWEATIDSRPAKILRVNGFERGVKVPSGNHTIDFTFRPGSMFLGLFAAAAAVLLLLAVCLWRPWARLPA